MGRAYRKMVTRDILLNALILSMMSFVAGSKVCVLNSTQIKTATSCANHLPCTDQDLIFLHDINKVSFKHSEADIYFCSSDYNFSNISGEYRFTDLLNVTLAGVSPTSNIHCNNYNSGFLFRNVREITISNVRLIQCGFGNELEEFSIPFKSAMYIANSSAIKFSNVRVESSRGIGIALVNNQGRIDIISSSFNNNHDPEYTEPGGGVFIESSTSRDAAYNIVRCNFTGNSASINSEKENHFTYSHRTDVIDFVRGGGLNAYFRAETNNINMTITGSVFDSNMAQHGGALCLSFQHSAHNVSVTVSASIFHNNRAIARGGAVSAGYVQETGNMSQNSVIFRFCKFTNNYGEMGGAVYLYAAPKQTLEQNLNYFEFHDCTWEANEGTYGSAILISRYTSKKFFRDGSLPVPLFNNCSFENNLDQKVPFGPAIENAEISQFGRGAVYVNLFLVKLSGNTTFIENKNNSALYLFSSILDVTPNSYLVFERNVGYEGGAINLRGFSSIYVNDNVTIKFDSNIAWNRGGAIFHATLIDPSHLTEINCFIKYAGQNDNVTNRNIKVHFVNNTILNYGLHMTGTRRGQSIFLSSAIPCNIIYNGKDYMIERALNSTATFIFEDGLKSDTLATYPSNLAIIERLPEFIIPGKKVKLDILTTDDIHNEVPSPVYRIESDPKVISNITIDPSYAITTNNIIKIRGPPKSKGRVIVTILEQEDVALTFDIILDECPPGYIYNNWSSVCECSANTKTLYLGIKRCKLRDHRATLIPGYWAGYVTDDPSDGSFRTSNCPLGYCRNELNESEFLLPAKASLDDITHVVCVTNRMGIMCGECKENSSVHYNTQGTFDCKSEQKCHLGILLFFLSQILPVTFLFLVVILFDIQLTTGALNGFLFFMQVFSTLHITANNIISFPPVTGQLLIALNSIVKVFNLNFFVIPGLEFCLFKGANSYDILAFEYVIVVYSLLLVLLTVLCLNRRCSKHMKVLQGRKIVPVTSIIHGLSGFLVLCYARTTSVTLKILTPGLLRGKGLHYFEIVALYHGKMIFFDSQHSKYAVPAIFALIFMTSLPPFLLLIYPLCYRVLALLRLEESKFTKLLCRVIPLEKFRPFFDSFQGEFRDKHRYFAGLYFVYRLLALVLFAISNDFTEFYFYLELLFILMCVLHGWVQPYKKSWHNRLDLYLFALLAVINGITLYNYIGAINLQDNRKAIDVLSTLQVLFAYSPLVFITIYTLKKLQIRKFLNYLLRKLKKGKGNDTEHAALSLSVLDEGRGSSTGYEKFD